MPGLLDGIRVIDFFTPLCLGQRVGIFAGSGVGKSSLLSMLTRAKGFDTVVIALVGERGREVREFLDDTLPTGRGSAIADSGRFADPKGIGHRTRRGVFPSIRRSIGRSIVRSVAGIATGGGRDRRFPRAIRTAVRTSNLREAGADHRRWQSLQGRLRIQSSLRHLNG